jgi:tRNA(fMet)-specific endonuclease VapC
MSLYVLDTDVLTLLQFNHPQVVERIKSHTLADLAITIISVEEQLLGWYTKARNAKKATDIAGAYQRMTRAIQTFGRFQVLSFSEAAIVRCEQLKSMRLNIGNKDLSIAAIVLEHSAIHVSRNESDFRRVPNLTLENWAQ